MKNNYLSRFILFLTALSSSFFIDTMTKSLIHPYEYIGSILLQAENPTKTEQDKKPKEDSDKITKEDLDFKPLSSFEKKQIVINLLKTITPQEISTVLMAQSVNELNLLCGEAGTRATNFFAKTFAPHINSTYGTIIAAYMITQPISNIEKLNKRSALIQTLINDTQLFNELDEALKQIKEQESLFLSLWQDGTPLTNKKILSNVYLDERFNILNKSAILQEASRSFPITIPITTLGIGFHIQKKIIGENDNTRSLSFRQILSEVWPAISYGWNHSTTSEKFAVSGVISLYGGAFLYVIKQIADQIILKEQIRKMIQNVMIASAETLRGLKKIDTLINNHPELQEALSLHTQLHRFLHETKHISRALAVVLKQLDSNTFNGEPSVFSLQGRTLALYKRLIEVKDAFAPALAAAGEIDAYLSTAKLIKTSDRVKYCIAQYLNNTTPCIALKNSWNILVDPQLVVTETITFGKDSVPNMLLTGPNGSGKSTFMRATIYNVILAQTFGIAAADECVLTPFSKISTYLNIKEDYEHGLSTFMAERKRVDEITKIISELQPHEFSFVIMDEVFKGTKEEQGSERVYNFGKLIAAIPQSMCILATHFTSPVKLEETTLGRFKNFHVEIQKLNEIEYKRVFKLKSGPNDWWLNNPQECDNFIEWLQTVA